MERTWDRHSLFCSEFRRRMLTGQWKPGDRLPTREDLRDELGSSLATIQKAINRLQEEGFVLSRGRAGTFVASRLPNQYCIGLAMGGRPGRDMFWSRMWQALELEARQIAAAGDRQLTYYYGLREPGGGDTSRLVDDIQNGCLAGVFLAGVPVRRLMSTPVLSSPSIRVAAMSTEVADLPDVLKVQLQPHLERVIGDLVADGRRRIGLVQSSLIPSCLPRWQMDLARHGLTFDPYSAVTAFPGDFRALQAAMYHMMRQPPDHRPDALVVTDDHMVEPVTAALRDARIVCPDEATIVAHCNYPLPPVHHVPVTFIGYDLAEMLDRVVAWIAPWPRGRAEGSAAPPAAGDMPFHAVYEDDLPVERRKRLRVTPIEKPTPAEMGDKYLTAASFI